MMLQRDRKEAQHLTTLVNEGRLIRAVGTKSHSASLNRQYHLDNFGTVEATSAAPQRQTPNTHRPTPEEEDRALLVKICRMGMC